MEEKQNISLIDINFLPVTEDELKTIQAYRDKKISFNFKKRFILSIILCVVLGATEFYAHYKNPKLGQFTPTLIFIIIAFVVFNALSYGYVVLKKKMSLYGEHMSFVKGTVDTKYDHVKLSKENKHSSHDFVLFDFDNFHCKDAVKVKDPDDFINMKPGDDILVVKSTFYGEDSFEAFRM